MFPVWMEMNEKTLDKNATRVRIICVHGHMPISGQHARPIYEMQTGFNFIFYRVENVTYNRYVKVSKLL